MPKIVLRFERLEDRRLLTSDLLGGLDEYRAIDGSGNNLANPAWGVAHADLLRIVAPDYGDGVWTPAGDGMPSPREISNLVVAQSGSVENDRFLSDFVWQWGQFLDHDLDLTEPADPAENFSIEVPTGDPFFDPFGTGTQTIALSRSHWNPDTGDSVGNPRQQVNAITAFIDASNVYGSDADRAAALRTFVGGKLKTSPGDLLPFNVTGQANAGGPSPSLFLAGDVRANEQVGLTAMHTLFVREHNRLAEEIAARDPGLSDEEIYQRARAVVVAQMQVITFNEFLPALLGRGPLGAYPGYDPSVNPGISNLFSTASYRFGHSMLSPTLLRLGEDGSTIAAGDLPLRRAFFNPQAILDEGIDPLLRGLASQHAQEIDNLVIDDVRNFLFGPPGAGGFDLPSLNIQRGRDHGLPRYNQIRRELGLAPATDFADISSDPDVQAALRAAYGDVENIDAWIGALAEDHLPGGSLGELNATVIADQFLRLRAGDRMWYQNIFSGEALEELQSTTLADIIVRNTGIRNIQHSVFFILPAHDVVGRDEAGGWWRLSLDALHDYSADGRPEGAGLTSERMGDWEESADWQDTRHVDFDGDGAADVLGRAASGDWWAGVNSGGQLQNRLVGAWAADAGWQDVFVEDFTGDGLPDVLGRTAAGEWWLGRNVGGVLVNERFGQWAEPIAMSGDHVMNDSGTLWTHVLSGDFNGDGLRDLIGKTLDGQWWAGLNTGAGLDNVFFGAWSGETNWLDAVVADVNADGLDDVLARAEDGTWWLGECDGQGLVTRPFGHWAPEPAAGPAQDSFTSWSKPGAWRNVTIADVNGDGYPDLLGRHTSGQWWAGLNLHGGQLVNQAYGAWTSETRWRDVMFADFDGNGLVDVLGRASSGDWWLSANDGESFHNRSLAAWSPEVRFSDVGHVASDETSLAATDLALAVAFGELAEEEE